MADVKVVAQTCMAAAADAQRIEPYPNRTTRLGELSIFRALPLRGRRLVGPWCFLDRYGPLSFTDGKPMDVAPHPHIGLQTVTWLVQGEVAHKDSLGYESVLRPGGVNIMTAGAGIAHAEETPPDHSGRLEGVQLWVALPEAYRHGPPEFQHLEEVPRLELRGGAVLVFAGSVASANSAARHFSGILGAELQVHRGGMLAFPLEQHHEHALLVLSGNALLQGVDLEVNTLYYLGTGRSELELSSQPGARLLLIGGPPFPEKILMWWNFVARTTEEIADARAAWEKKERFGDVKTYRGPRLPAPPLTKFAPANPAS